MTRYTCGLAATTLLVGLAALSAPALAERTRGTDPAPRSLRGNGNWQRDGRTAQRWDIDVTRRDDDSIEGRVTLSGSPLLRSGTLRGRLDGRRVAGSVCDDNGMQAATFVGVVTPSGVWQGTYQDRTGEVGRWSWDGAPPTR
ncbi:MAG: hypothetical protein SF182_23355 [Deltaproteobacteria bacterium]|nr:hypothetical protein [Deltaproteobacteria bacterium]